MTSSSAHSSSNGKLQFGSQELWLLFFPILLTTFSNCLFQIAEKLLLARLSAHAMEAAVSATYAYQVFQGPCIALAMMAQVFVGRWQGAQEAKAIGPGIWQFIWFSLLSMLITVPCSVLYGSYYFHATPIEPEVWPYYYLLISFNFLYPLGAALSCFYLGQAKTRFVLAATVGAQLVKLGLTYLLIFGIDGLMPACGLLGGAIASAIAQGGFCLLLFANFMKKKHAELFATRTFHFQLRLFWECIHPGTLRALNRILSFASWAAIAHLMAIKGGNYLLVLSIGGTLFFFLPCFADALSQAQITVVSHLLGAKKFTLLDRAFRSATILSLVIIFFASIPLVAFAPWTFHTLFSNMTLGDSEIRTLFFGVFVSFAFYTFGYVPISYILAFKDTRFSLFMGAMNWVNGYLLMYLALDHLHIAALNFWLTLSLMHLTTSLMYLWRMRWLQSRAIAHST